MTQHEMLAPVQSQEIPSLLMLPITAQTKSLFADVAGRPVLLPRTLMARVVAEYAQA